MHGCGVVWCGVMWCTQFFRDGVAPRQVHQAVEVFVGRVSGLVLEKVVPHVAGILTTGRMFSVKY